MPHQNFETVAGCQTRITCTITASEGTDTTLSAYVMVAGASHAATLESGGVLVFPALTPGSYLYEIRAGEKPVAFGHLLARPSAYPDTITDAVDATLSADLTGKAVTLAITLAKGARGPQGVSAYEAAVAAGYTGTEAEWLGGVANIATMESSATASAAAAAASAAEAADSATLAQGYKEAAESSATAAAASETAAAASAESASSMYSNARGQAQASAASANEAATSAENAATSAATATTAAETATSKATEAGESATAAAVSATAAAADAATVVAIRDELAADVGLPDSDFAAWTLARTGKVYRSRVYKSSYNTAPAVVGVEAKLLDNAGLQHECSTDTAEGVDDYADIHLFQWFNCNYIRVKNGEPRVTALEGSGAYTTEGSVDVGVCGPCFWWRVEDSEDGNYQLWTISDSPHPELGLVPWVECVRSDGTLAPYWCHSKYFSGMAADGFLRSLPGLPVYNFISYNLSIDYYAAKGKSYPGGKSCVHLFGMIFDIIKNATKDTQSIHRGNTDGDYQLSPSSTRSTLADYFPLTAANAEKIDIGVTVNIGTSTDRNNANNYNLVRQARVVSKETSGSEVLIHLDVATNFALNSTSYILSTMPSSAGETDSVLGHHDGSAVSYTNGRHSYRVQGTEYGIGAWYIACDIAMYSQSDYTKKIYACPVNVMPTRDTSIIARDWVYVCTMPVNGTGTLNTGDIAVDTTHAVLWPSAFVSSDAEGWMDAHYTGTTQNTWLEYLVGGRLGNASQAGSAFVNALNVLSAAYWPYAGRD